MRQCTIDGCDQRYVARGMCRSHYNRAKRRGEVYEFPTMGHEKKPIAPRFWKHVEKTETCWNWTATKYNGYGRFKVGQSMVTAHRVSYEMANGPIPDGMQVDHMCFNHSCVNPAHLRLASPKENKENLPCARRDSSSGIRGVFWYKKSRKWVAQVRHRGVLHTAGYFDDISEAEAAAVALRKKLFTHNLVDRRGGTPA